MNSNIYNPKIIEKKWKEIWENNSTYFSRVDKSKNKIHVLDMFPYPSGEGLHTGHVKIYTASDVYARLKRMQGYNVLHATGFDAFGLPAEQFAIKNKINPKISTLKNVENFERQMKNLGFSYDWSRTVNTTDPEFYKWTQWIFKQLYKKGLCYESFEPINWCPSCKTGLANEDLEEGKCERCGNVVEKKPIRQWVIKITDYAEKLLIGLEGLNWKENIKEMQRNWIGKNVGVKYKLKVKDLDLEIETYSTHFEAFYADTFAVIAADHKLLQTLVKGLKNEKEILDFAKNILVKKNNLGFKEVEEHEGVFTGRYLLDPITKTEFPLWVSSYALSDYGTGIIKCSAHDSRDFAFAKKYNLPLRTVMYPNDETEKQKIKNLEYCFNDFENAILEEPKEFFGKNPKEAHIEILNYLTGNKFAEKSTQYKLRDWVFARQRYWGEPFPIVYDKNHKSFLVSDSNLPVILPDVESYEPTGDGESPLKNIKDWVEIKGKINEEGEFVSDPEGDIFYRETNTMPQWAGSSWYWLRYMDPKNSTKLINSANEEYWGNVDIYLGGMEHATRHLIYARFWNIFLNEIGIVSHSEPFQKLEPVGLVLAEGGVKMSKRLGNVINPDDVIQEYSADILRLYIVFAGSYHDTFAWDTKAVAGSKRFLDRVWNLQFSIRRDVKPTPELESLLHKTIKKVTQDYERLQFNTAIAQLMSLLNILEKYDGINAETFEILIKLLAPVTPFISEELWALLGNTETIHLSAWPVYDESKCADPISTIAFQVNGKLRGSFTVESSISNLELTTLVKSSDQYKKWVGKTDPKKIIIVKNKIINVVI